ncbi:AzlD domain-containing protein [Bacteriovoracaceae bacterium]|nr:AzlD domain-containing protein [Bacteriovoracaceae bacterium]
MEKHSLFWVIVSGVVLLTFSIRSSFILFGDKIKLPNFLKQGLPFFTVAIFPALVSPALFYFNGSSNILLGKERILAALIALLISIKTENVIYTLVIGFLSLKVLQLI